MRTTLAASFLLILLSTGCSTGPAPKPIEKAPPEPVTGLHALAQMFTSARVWSPDAQILRVVSLQVGTLKPQIGKAPAWQAVFFSPTLAQSRSYVYSVMDVGTSIREGIFPDPAVPFASRNQTAQPFSIQAAKKDTDEIYGTALDHAKDYAAKNPDMTINYQMELNNRSPAVAWRVIWGESASHSSYSVLVDAATGAFIEVLH